MTYAALIAGAKAFLWYAYRHAGWALPEDDPVLWNAHVRLLAELNDLGPVIVAPGLGKKTNVVDGRGMIRAMIKSDSNRIFLFAASDARTQSIKCTFLLPPGDYFDIKVYGENRIVTANGNKLIDTFQPLDVHIYQLN